MGKYFGTDGFRGKAGAELTADHAFKIGRFLGWYYNKIKEQRGEKANARIVIGKDTRRSCYMLEYSLVGGIAASGADAYLLHVATTPCVAFCAQKGTFECGVMISASHNAFYDNGIKLLNENGEKMEQELLDLIEAYLDGEVTAFGETYTELPAATRERVGIAVDYVAGRNRYIAHLIALGTPMNGFRIGLDLANGASSHVAKPIFEALGAEVHVINDSPDGININKNCGSTHMESLCAFVRDRGLDAGFAFDGDADRCLIVNEKGEIMDGDHVLYIAGKYLKEKGDLPHDTVVATVMSNYGLFKSLEKIGLSCAVTDVGDKYVYECMAKNGYALGGEQSGHIVFLRHATTGDGILTALMMMEILVMSGSKLSALDAGLTTYPQSLFNFRVTDKKAARNDPAVLALSEELEKALDGNGRMLLRVSGTEPLIRLLIETDREDVTAAYGAKFEALFREKGYLTE